jgi:hypothetical protein
MVLNVTLFPDFDQTCFLGLSDFSLSLAQNPWKNHDFGPWRTMCLAERHANFELVKVGLESTSSELASEQKTIKSSSVIEKLEILSMNHSISIFCYGYQNGSDSHN